MSAGFARSPHANSACAAARRPAAGRRSASRRTGLFPRSGACAFRAARFATQDSFDGGFNFCRADVHQRRREAGGQGWWTDYPDADTQLLDPPLRADQDARQPAAPTGEPNHLVVRADRRRALSTARSSTSRTPARASSATRRSRALRDYLLKGGFLWVDDFWGDAGPGSSGSEIGRVLPPERYPDRRHHAGPPALPDDVRGAEADSADPVDRPLAPQRRRDLGARRRQRRADHPRHQRRARAA